MNIPENIKNDWRYQNQDSYLNELTFHYTDYKSKAKGEHDHCEFCSAKFSNEIHDCLKSGFTDQENYRWICSDCFEFFAEALSLTRN